MPTPTEQTAPAYTSQSRWNVERPRVLVACCSDGRLQGAIDEFLRNHNGLRLTARVRAYRAEVLANRQIQFVPML